MVVVIKRSMLSPFFAMIQEINTDNIVSACSKAAYSMVDEDLTKCRSWYAWCRSTWAACLGPSLLVLLDALEILV